MTKIVILYESSAIKSIHLFKLCLKSLDNLKISINSFDINCLLQYDKNSHKNKDNKCQYWV